MQEYQHLERDLRGPVAVSEILSAAMLFAQYRQEHGGDLPAPQQILPLVESNTRFWTRLALEAPAAVTVLKEADAQIATLDQVLGG